ncbi:hypothetical protein BZG36_05219 [Bifiguratus adelaidae]|uniref:Glycosyltransferase family 28 N-terminal domain-containing protein n=1 Tax=Bifiguratus adelaidae TaxID=1938954 RepID=A0A261XWV4_9FUNG|nr:hypothetical protein BZG36_05219 [Bifiguratus adelaidae]
MFELGVSVVDAIAHSEEGKALKTVPRLQIFKQLRTVFKPLMIAWQLALKNALGTYKPDLAILATFPAFFGPYILKNANVPYIVVHTVPAWPTRDFLPPNLGSFTSPLGLLNLCAWMLGNVVNDSYMLSPLDDEVRIAEGLPPHTSGEKKEMKESRAKTLTLHIVSPALVPTPADWPPSQQMAGQCILQKDRRIWDEETQTLLAPSTLVNYRPDPLLEAFIAKATSSETPVLYFGFGSMLGTLVDSKQSLKVIDAVLAGTAAHERPVAMIVHVTGLSSQDTDAIQTPDSLKERVHFHRGFVPHSWLFPRCDMIIHHGGIGTTQAAILYGLRRDEKAGDNQYYGPVQWIVAATTLSDQPYWGDCISRRKLGPASILSDKLTSAHVLAAVGQALFGDIRQRQLWKQNVGDLGLRMWKGKDGSDFAAEEID